MTLGGGTETEVLLLSILPNALAMGSVARRPRGTDASESVSQLRRHLVGGSVRLMEESRRYLRIVVAREEGSKTLVCHAHKPHGGWWLEGSNSAVLIRSTGSKPKPIAEGERFVARELAELRAGGVEVLDAYHRARVQQLRRLLTAHRARLD